MDGLPSTTKTQQQQLDRSDMIIRHIVLWLKTFVSTLRWSV